LDHPVHGVTPAVLEELRVLLHLAAGERLEAGADALREPHASHDEPEARAERALRLPSREVECRGDRHGLGGLLLLHSVSFARRGTSAVYAASMRPEDGVRVRPARPGDAGELSRLRWEHCLELWDRPPEDAPDRDAFDEAFERFLSGAEPDDAW